MSFFAFTGCDSSGHKFIVTVFETGEIRVRSATSGMGHSLHVFTRHPVDLELLVLRAVKQGSQPAVMASNLLSILVTYCSSSLTDLKCWEPAL